MLGTYEAHLHPDPNFPIIYNKLYADRPLDSGILHWHESIELVLCLSGNGTIISDADKIHLETGDIAVINSSCLHTVYSSSSMEYYYLIADTSLFDESDMPISSVLLQPKIHDEKANQYFHAIISEIQNKQNHYRTGAKASILWLFVYLYRNYKQAEFYSNSPQNTEGKLAVVKSAIAYIRRNFTNDINIEDVSRHIGISKYYLCHTFKEITGQTIVGYINFLRCKNARRLISSGICNVSESAHMSGYKNLSYFTKTYKKIMGELPSQIIVD